MATYLDNFDIRSAGGNGSVDLPLEPRAHASTTDIDDSIQTETTAWLLLTIAAPTNYGMMDTEVWIDLDKATTGFGAVETTATIQFLVGRKVDGTNVRLGADSHAATTAISGTNAAADGGLAAVVKVGDIAAGETVYIYGNMSADAASDMELPYRCTYKSRGTAAFTDVAAG